MDTQLIIAISVVSLILLITLIFLLVRRTVVAKLVGYTWQRKVWLEHYIWVKESSYGGYPKGSRNQTSKRETYYSNEIISYNTQTTHNADGTPSTTTVPVYGIVPHQRTKYFYEIQRWQDSRELLSEGGKQSNVYWPPYTLNVSTSERIRKTKEIYLVFFQSAKGKTYKRQLPESEWTTLDEQSTYRLRITLYGKVTQIAPATTQAVVNREKD
jgi:hypothetical protein